jgi:nucleoside-diphosphate-sugar epimerase
MARGLARAHDVLPLTRAEWDITTGPRDFGHVDAVVHCAALADDWAPLGVSMLANRVGTRNVVASFPGARFVHISTSSVYDAFTPSVTVREDAPRARRFLSSYSESKAAAEGELPADAVVLRPHAVYGPGDRTLLPRILSAVRAGRLRLPEGAAVSHTLTHIDNLVLAASLALTGPVGIYNIGDDTDVLLSAVLAEFVKRRGRDARIVSIPYRTAFAAAGALERVAAVTRSRPRITRYAISQLGLERTLDLTAARERLGYRPGPTTLAGAEEW